MKKLFVLLGLIFGLTAFARAQSITYSNSIVFQSLNNATNTGSSVILGTAKISSKTYQLQVQHGGLASLTNLNSVFQISMDNANWTPVFTNQPSLTNNGAIDATNISMGTFTIYGRVVQYNTNSAAQSAGAVIVIAPLSL